MYHSNKGYLGVFNILFTLAALWLLVTRWGEVTVPYRLLLIVCALMFTVWQPFLLYLKARKQAAGKAVKEPKKKNSRSILWGHNLHPGGPCD